MTHLRRLMQEELQRRNYSEITAVCYVRHVAAFAKHFGRSPDLLGTEEIKQFQLHLIQKKVSWATTVSAWRVSPCQKAGVKGRWHDNRHTLVTELAESGAGDEVIMSIAGHVSRAMLSRYSHVRMEAKRRALDEIAVRQRGADEKRQQELEGLQQAAIVAPPVVVQ